MRLAIPVVDGEAAHHGGTRLIELVIRRDGVRIERARQRHHLHHGAGLVEVRHDGIPKTFRRCGRELVRVVTRDVRPGDDAPRVRFHDDQGAALGLVFLNAVRKRPLGHYLDGAVERKLQCHPVDRILSLPVTEHDRLVREVPHRRLEAILPMKRLVVVALDAIVAHAFVVGEAEQVGGQARSSHTTVHIGALGFGDLPDAGQSKFVQLLGGRGRHPARQVNELPVGAQVIEDLSDIQVEDRCQLIGNALSLRG